MSAVPERAGVAGGQMSAPTHQLRVRTSDDEGLTPHVVCVVTARSAEPDGEGRVVGHVRGTSHLNSAS